MMLLLTTIDKEVQVRDFSCILDTLETAFDFLGLIAANGEQILKAEVIDNDERIQLPAEAFTRGGSCFSTPIQQLEHEWRQILAEPLDLPDTNWLINLTQQRMQLNEDRMNHYRHMITHLTIGLEHARTIPCSES